MSFRPAACCEGRQAAHPGTDGLLPDGLRPRRPDPGPRPAFCIDTGGIIADPRATNVHRAWPFTIDGAVVPPRDDEFLGIVAPGGTINISGNTVRIARGGKLDVGNAAWSPNPLVTTCCNMLNGGTIVLATRLSSIPTARAWLWWSPALVDLLQGAAVTAASNLIQLRRRSRATDLPGRRPGAALAAPQPATVRAPASFCPAQSSGQRRAGGGAT